MADYRQLHTRMWSSDRWFIELKPSYKLLFIYLFSNERASVSGLYEIPIRVISFETGLDKETITSGFGVFKDANKVLYDFETGVVYVRNMFKYQGSNSPKLQARIQADLKAVPNCSLKDVWLQENRVLIGYGNGMDTSYSVSVSSSDSVSVDSEGGGVGEGAVFAAYKNNIGMLTPMNADALKADIDDYTQDWVLAAIEYAVKQEKKSLAYVEGVLKGWKRDGLTDPRKQTEKQSKNGNGSTGQKNADIIRKAAQNARR